MVPTGSRAAEMVPLVIASPAMLLLLPSEQSR
jgi:hypothetical protein